MQAQYITGHVYAKSWPCKLCATWVSEMAILATLVEFAPIGLNVRGWDCRCLCGICEVDLGRR